MSYIVLPLFHVQLSSEQRIGLLIKRIPTMSYVLLPLFHVQLSGEQAIRYV